jgi:hypothetical protein
MKRIFCTLILLITFLLYQVEANISISRSVSTFFSFQNKGENNQFFFTLVSSNLFCLPWKSDDSKGQKTVSGPEFPSGSVVHSRINWNFDSQFIKNYITKQITDFSKVIILFRKKDMIFPFHNFW